MAGTYLTNGVVLKRRDYRESDRLLTLYTEEYGKVEAVARGVKKSTSKLAGHLEPFSFSSFMLARGRVFDIVATSVKRSSFRLPHNDLVAFALASSFFESVDRLTRPHQKDRALFHLLIEFLAVLEDSPSAAHEAPVFQRALILEYYLFRLLEQLGYRPALDHCVLGSEALASGPATFLLHQGGITCDTHLPHGTDGHRLSAEAVEVLRCMADHELEPLRLMKRDAEVFRSVALVVNAFLTYHIDDGLHSESFLTSVLQHAL